MSALVQALAAGATIVTPNNRLARELVARFDAARLAEGARSWGAAQVLPWNLWLGRIWRAALAARVEPQPASLLDASAARELWHAIVAAHRQDLLNPRGAARDAADAWTTFHAWRDDEEALDRALAGAHADVEVFVRWAQRYRARLRELRAVDPAQLPDLLARLAAPSWIAGSGSVVMNGFLALAPQQRRLVAALRAAGMAIEEIAPAAPAVSQRRRTAFATARDEIAGALSFARERVATDRSARVAIVVGDLEQRREEIVALAEEVLCPERLLAPDADAPRPYGISLGVPLSTVPLVACAVDLIALTVGPVDATLAASVLRSPFLPDAQARWRARSGVERTWLELGLRRVDWPDVIAALRRCDSELHQRLLAVSLPQRSARAPRDWAQAWSDWLAAMGWPESGTLSSAQWQAREAWSATLARFASAGVVTGALPAAAAFDALRALLADALFQPESAPAQIQILGVLEAAGLSFDSAWLAGFDAERWPRPATPNPFLPLAWQQARGVPRAHADTALAQAQALTAALVAIAPDVVVSHAMTLDDAPASISPLFADWTPFEEARRLASHRFADAIAPAVLDRWAERNAPPLVPGARVRGGAQLFDTHSACPFQAFARFRLRAEALSGCPEGLTAPERGTVLHATLKAFWDGLAGQRALLALDPAQLAARIGAAVDAGKAALEPRRWRAVAPAVAHAEAGRLEATLRAWIDESERTRPAFRVRSHEQRLEATIDGIALCVRIDRVDELANGDLAIVDYKSGRVVKPIRWFDARPNGIQLAVYAAALEPTADAPVRALAYAQVKAGEIALAGLIADHAEWPALSPVHSIPDCRDWPAARARLRERVAQLAADIRAGGAAIVPRNEAATCRICRLHSLCRIQMLDDRADAPGAGAGDE